MDLGGRILSCCMLRKDCREGLRKALRCSGVRAEDSKAPLPLGQFDQGVPIQNSDY